MNTTKQTTESCVCTAVCVGVVDLGEQYLEKYRKTVYKVAFAWETAVTSGKAIPKLLAKEFIVSAYRKSGLRVFLNHWNGREYEDEEFEELDLCEQIGKPCLLQVFLSEDGAEANIVNVMPLLHGMPLPTTSTPFIWTADLLGDVVFPGSPNRFGS